MDTFLTLRLIWWWFQDPQSTVVTFGFETWVFEKLSQLPTTTCHHPPTEYNLSQKLAFDWKRLLDPTYPTRPRIVPRCSFRLAFATFAVLATDNRIAAVVSFDPWKKVWIELLTVAVVWPLFKTATYGRCSQVIRLVLSSSSASACSKFSQ